MKIKVLILLIFCSYLNFAQEIARINFNTGDKEIETHLNDVNVYASLDMDVFKKDLGIKFGVTLDEVDRYIVKERIPPAEVYYGYCLSSTTRKSLSSIMKMRSEKNGWGAIAKDLGIKPGSKQFHALKNNTLKKIDKDKIKKMKKDKSNKNKKMGNTNKNK